MWKARFQLYICQKCGSSINFKKDLNLDLYDLKEIINCCKNQNIFYANATTTDIIWLESEGDGYQIRHFQRSFTYEPKIKGVLDGTYKQTIRPMGKHPIKKGDIIQFHGWKDRPYWSDWTWRIKVKVSRVENIMMFEHGILSGGIFWKWESLNLMAEADGIAKVEGKGYGESMGILFNQKYGKKISKEKGIPMQVIHWEEMEIIKEA